MEVNTHEMKLPQTIAISTIDYSKHTTYRAGMKARSRMVELISKKLGYM
jgi:hypothetical protein